MSALIALSSVTTFLVATTRAQQQQQQQPTPAEAAHIFQVLNEAENHLVRLADKATEAYERFGNCPDPACGQEINTCSIPACAANFANFSTSSGSGDDSFVCTDQNGAGFDSCACIPGQWRSLSASTIYLPSNIDFEVVTSQTAVCNFRSLDGDFFSTEHLREGASSFAVSRGTEANSARQYVTDLNGVSRVFPGQGQAQDRDTCSDFDVRKQPWFLQAVSGSRNIVVVVDSSGSMAYVDLPSGYTCQKDEELSQAPCNRFPNRMEITRGAVDALFQSFSPSDTVGLVDFNTEAMSRLGPNLLRGTSENIARFQQSIVELEPRKFGATFFRPAFTTAFELLAGSSSNTEACQNIITFITDGWPDEPRDAEEKALWATVQTIPMHWFPGRNTIITDTAPNVVVRYPIDGSKYRQGFAAPFWGSAIAEGQALLPANNKAHIFTFTISSGANGNYTQAIACENDGIWRHLNPSDDVHAMLSEFSQFSQYIKHRAAADMYWAPAHSGGNGRGVITVSRRVTAAQPVLNTVAVAAVDVTLDELLPSSQSWPATYTPWLENELNRRSQVNSECGEHGNIQCVLQALRSVSDAVCASPTLDECAATVAAVTQAQECANILNDGLNTAFCTELNTTTRLVPGAESSDAMCCNSISGQEPATLPCLAPLAQDDLTLLLQDLNAGQIPGPALAETVSVLMAAFDLNQNGLLDSEERYLMSGGLHPVQVQSFALADIDRDGKVSPGEDGDVTADTNLVEWAARELSEVETQWVAADVDKNGLVDSEEAQASLPGNPSEAQVAQLFELAGVTDYTFSDGSTGNGLTLAQWTTIANDDTNTHTHVDTNRDGVIDVTELSAALLDANAGQVPAPALPATAVNMMAQLDTNGDGVLSYAESIQGNLAASLRPATVQGFALADVNNDGQVSPDEYAERHPEGTTPLTGPVDLSGFANLPHTATEIDFESADTDGNGLIGTDELIAFNRTVPDDIPQTTYTFSDGSTGTGWTLDSFEQMLCSLPSDSNGNCRYDGSELEELIRDSNAGQNPAPANPATVDGIIASLDGDGDGVLNRSESAVVAGLLDPTIVQAFAITDTNGDGVISADEFAARYPEEDFSDLVASGDGNATFVDFAQAASPLFLATEQAFDNTDGDNNGLITADELKKFLETNLSATITAEQVDELLASRETTTFDSGNGPVTGLSLAQWETFLNEQALFIQADANGNGRVSIIELENILVQLNAGSLPTPATREMSTQIVIRRDTNADSQLSYTEFSSGCGAGLSGSTCLVSALKPTFVQAMSLADTNIDGLIDIEEYRARHVNAAEDLVFISSGDLVFFAQQNLTAAEQNFQRAVGFEIGEPIDGLVGVEELRVYQEQYITGEQPVTLAQSQSILDSSPLGVGSWEVQQIDGLGRPTGTSSFKEGLGLQQWEAMAPESVQNLYLSIDSAGNSNGFIEEPELERELNLLANPPPAVLTASNVLNAPSRDNNAVDSQWDFNESWNSGMEEYLTPEHVSAFRDADTDQNGWVSESELGVAKDFDATQVEVAYDGIPAGDLGPDRGMNLFDYSELSNIEIPDQVVDGGNNATEQVTTSRGLGTSTILGIVFGILACLLLLCLLLCLLYFCCCKADEDDLPYESTFDNMKEVSGKHVDASRVMEMEHHPPSPARRFAHEREAIIAAEGEDRQELIDMWLDQHDRLKRKDEKIRHSVTFGHVGVYEFDIEESSSDEEESYGPVKLKKYVVNRSRKVSVNKEDGFDEFDGSASWSSDSYTDSESDDDMDASYGRISLKKYSVKKMNQTTTTKTETLREASPTGSEVCARTLSPNSFSPYTHVGGESLRGQKRFSQHHQSNTDPYHLSASSGGVMIPEDPLSVDVTHSGMKIDKISPLATDLSDSPNLHQQHHYSNTTRLSSGTRSSTRITTTSHEPISTDENEE